MFIDVVKKVVPDRIYLKMKFRRIMKSSLDLNNPQTFNEKLQWLKLYDRNPEYSKMVDKFAVKEYIAKRIGSEYIIPTIGVWDRFEDIDFESLPEQFVLKCTHDSGGYYICKSKSKTDLIDVRDKISPNLSQNFYYIGREWPYKAITPRIIAEEYMEDSELSELADYKFYCFDGYVDCVMMCYDRESGDTKFYFFDKNWRLKRINKRGKDAPAGFSLPKPQCLDEMFSIAEELSKNIPFVRVDLYQCNGKVYFGELTFYPQSGFDPNYLPETDMYFGKLIDLKKAYSNKQKEKKNEI